MRKILLTGGPDAKSLRVVDVETGKPIEGVVKIELLCLPRDGALINVTQACRIAALDVTALDAGVPLIDLPDDQAGDIQCAIQPLADELNKSSIQPLVDELNKMVVQAMGLPADLVAKGATGLGLLPVEAPPRTTLAPGAPWPFPVSEQPIGQKRGA